MGGVYAVANLRGGGEYGEDWHEAGMKLKKQNVFDDFIAAAEWLIKNKYTSTPKLAIGGGSNGGLAGRRGDHAAARAFRRGASGRRRDGHAALPQVHNRLGLGLRLRLVGKPGRVQSALRLLAAITTSSAGTCYPPTMVTTADHDDRVVPGHSFKFAAAMQAAQSCAESRPDSHRDESRSRRGQAHLENHRRDRRPMGLPGSRARPEHERGNK